MRQPIHGIQFQYATKNIQQAKNKNNNKIK